MVREEHLTPVPDNADTDFGLTRDPQRGTYCEVRHVFDIDSGRNALVYRFHCDTDWALLPLELELMYANGATLRLVSERVLMAFNELRPFEASKSILLQ